MEIKGYKNRSRLILRKKTLDFIKKSAIIDASIDLKNVYNERWKVV